MIETFMGQIKELIKSNSNISNRLPQKQSSRSKVMVCYGCQQTGHFLRDCPQKVKKFPLNTRNQGTANSEVTVSQQQSGRSLNQHLN